MISIEKDKDKKKNPSKDRAWWQHAISQQLTDLLHTLSIGSSICFKSGLETAKMHLIFAALLLLARKELRQKRHSFTRFRNNLIMNMIIWHVLKYADNNKSFDEFLLTKLFLKRWQFRISLFSIRTMFFRFFFFFLHRFSNIVFMSFSSLYYHSKGIIYIGPESDHCLP